MLTKIKALCKNPLFLELVLGGFLLLVALIALLIFLLRPNPQPAEETTPPTVATVAPTLPPVAGIDVSEWQTDVDWAQVKDSGVEFVIIRAGWRGSEKGLLTPDTLAQAHYAGAKAAGLKVGAYLFTQAITVEEGIEDANFLLDQVKDWELDMPLVYNWEHLDDSYRTANMTDRNLTDITKAFCQTIAAAGQEPMVYFDTNLGLTRLFLDELTEYKFWLAQYSNRMQFFYPVDMWQYTSTGSVPGIPGNVDLDWYYPK